MATPGHHLQSPAPSLHGEDFSVPPLAVRAIYAGSFDPFTLAHKDIAARAAKMYSEVIIAIGVNPGKSPMFTPEEKKALIEKELEDLKGNFKVVIFEGLLAHYAISQKASVLIRGVRGITDTDFESQLASINREQSGFEDLETILMPSRKEYENVSSSATKLLIKDGGDVRNYVSARVEQAMRNKLEGKPILSTEDATFEAAMDPKRAEKIVYDRWMALAKRLRVTDSVARQTAQELITAYSEPHRSYHNLVHIAEGLVAIEGFRDHLAALDAFEFAWFFHDFVYDPSDTVKGSNERNSITKMQQAADRLRIPVGVTNRSCQFVEATIDHKIYEGDLDGEFFIDNDLWILGSPPERFQKYFSDIRSEFGIYSDLIYNSGRLQFINSMLSRERIFKTDYFALQFEANIHPNLERERAAIVWGSVTAITGSIGSGKSTVMEQLKAQGFFCLSADQIAEELRQPGTLTYDNIVAHFGDQVLNEDKTINRKTLGKIVFSDPKERKTLEAILQPAIEHESLERFAQKVIDKEPLLAYEVPVLFEAGVEDRGFKKIVFVSADEQTRLARVMARDGISETQAKAKINAQLPDAEKAAKSDIVIDNSSDVTALSTELLKLL